MNMALSHVSKQQFDAAHRLLQVVERLLKDGDSVISKVTGRKTSIQEWEQFPESEQEDLRTGFRYYYHSHPCPGSRAEHGHFHLFKRVGMGDQPSSYCHILAIGVNGSALPTRFFSTNLWVTGETSQPAEVVSQFARDFIFDSPSVDPVAEWIREMLTLFSREVLELLHARDSRCAELSIRRPGFADDRRTIQLAQVAINLPAKLLEIEGWQNEYQIN